MRGGKIDGTTFIRPARVAFVAEPSLDALRASVVNATSAWGGIHAVMLATDEPGKVASLATAVGVDFFYAADESEATTEVCKTPGFGWRGSGMWGPYGEPDGEYLSRLFGPDRFLDRLEGRPFELRWRPDDPLADLLATWLGSYGDHPFGTRLREAFEQNAVVVDIPADGTIPDVTSPTPIALTGTEIDYSGRAQFSGVVVLDPTDAMRLAHFWNLRALGGTVFPWPITGGTRLSHALVEWLARGRDTGTFGAWRQADGTPLPSRVLIDLPSDVADVDSLLQGLIDSCGLTFMPAGGAPYIEGWNGSHPMSTDYSRSFSTIISADDTTVVVPLPDFPPGNTRDLMPGMVVAQVELHREELDPDRWCAMPNVRKLGDRLTLQVMSPMWRPTRNGRAIAIQASEDSLELPLVAPLTVMSALFEGSGWDCVQSSNGIFTTRLIDTLGGVTSRVGNQPAIRETLLDVRRSPIGKTVRQLESTAEHARGEWPHHLFSRLTPSEYGSVVVRYLIARRLLRPHLRVRCPTCAVELSFRPEDLATNVECEMCTTQFALGTALASRKGNQGWHYQLPSNMDEDHLRETLALMAVTSVFASRLMGSELDKSFYGLLLEEPRVKGNPPGHKCDIDVVISLHDLGAPVLVVGEVKHRGVVDTEDLANLGRVQTWLRSMGIECLILRGTLGDTVTGEEKVALRELSEQAPQSLHGWEPVLPIVLTGGELSVPEMHDRHPYQWRGPGNNYTSFAIESCKRNLGLVSVVPAHESGRKWEFTWNDDPASEPNGMDDVSNGL
jgi:hypothetical protein